MARNSAMRLEVDEDIRAARAAATSIPVPLALESAMVEVD
jgi:hypothetical protein